MRGSPGRRSWLAGICRLVCGSVSILVYFGFAFGHVQQAIISYLVKMGFCHADKNMGYITLIPFRLFAAGQFKLQISHVCLGTSQGFYGAHVPVNIHFFAMFLLLNLCGPDLQLNGLTVSLSLGYGGLNIVGAEDFDVHFLKSARW